MTSSISRVKLTVSVLSSSLPASIFERSSTSLIRPSRWVPAAFTRRSGSSAFSVPKRAALPTIISVRPMMALSGVRSSWLMLARNCDLRSLASASCRLLSWISSNSRTFSIAIAAWSANVSTSAICLSVNGSTSVLMRPMTPFGIPSRSIGTASTVPKRKHFLRLGECVFRVCPDVDDLHRAAFEQSSAHRGSTASADGGTLPKLQKFRRYIMRGHRVARIAVVTENHSSCCAAEPDSRTQESIEHGLQIEGRAADDLEHVGGGGLLLQRLAQFFEQARVLDRDHRLVCEGGE